MSPRNEAGVVVFIEHPGRREVAARPRHHRRPRVHRLPPQCSVASRFTAGDAGFLTLSQWSLLDR
jgi:hypothetical protein